MILSALAVASVMAPGSVMAADLAPIMKAPVAPPPVAYRWTGCYIGGNVGGAWSNANYTLDNSVFVEDFDFNPSSVIGGVQGGCNYQVQPELAGRHRGHVVRNRSQADE